MDALSALDPLVQMQQQADMSKPRGRKRLTSPERWELQQLRNAAAIPIVRVLTLVDHMMIVL